MSNYIEMRTAALSLEERKSRFHPCSEGRANCCKQSSQISVTAGDQLNILSAFESQNIKEATILRAIIRATSGDQNSCPFLDEQNNCSIYVNRPLVCISYGNGGDCRIDGINQAAEQTQRIPIERVKLAMCDECHTTARENWMSIPLSDIKAFQEIKGFVEIQRDNLGMKTFVMERLSPALAKLSKMPVVA